MRLALALVLAVLPVSNAAALLEDRGVVTVTGSGTVDPLHEVRNPHVAAWSMDLQYPTVSCHVDVTERLSTYASGNGIGWIDCTGAVTTSASCAAERVGLTLTLACVNFDEVAAVLQIVPRGDATRFDSYDVVGAIAVP